MLKCPLGTKRTFYGVAHMSVNRVEADVICHKQYKDVRNLDHNNPAPRYAVTSTASAPRARTVRRNTRNTSTPRIAASPPQLTVNLEVHAFDLSRPRAGEVAFRHLGRRSETNRSACRFETAKVLDLRMLPTLLARANEIVE